MYIKDYKKKRKRTSESIRRNNFNNYRVHKLYSYPIQGIALFIVPDMMDEVSLEKR